MESTGRPTSLYIGLNRVEGVRNLAVGLVGTTVLILTFTLIFLYPLNREGAVSPLLFHIVLAADVLALYAFGFAAFFYSLVMEEMSHNDPGSQRRLNVADVCLQVGIGIFALVPALILLAVGIYDVALFAFVLWALNLFVVLRSWGAYKFTVT